jgi:inosine-uridine nucleoside N-ribohydrolase
MSWIAVGASAVQAFGQYKSGQAAKAQGEAVAGQLEYQGTVEQNNAMQQAQMIRRAQRNAVGQADTAAAASGIVVGQGSAGEVDRQIYEDSEHDAYQAILSGNRRQRQLDLQAVSARTGGNIAAANANAQAVSTVMGGALKGYGNWASMQKYNFNGDASGTVYSRSGSDIMARR